MTRYLRSLSGGSGGMIPVNKNRRLAKGSLGQTGVRLAEW